jgi:protein tyrosine phosphatase (PTP) superfamily phosphohydrolase (DUF442 family)
LIVAGCQSTAPHPVTVEVDGVRNVSRAGDIYVAGTPTYDGLRRLKAEGVTTVIDLRLADQVGPDAASDAEKLGLRRIHLPMNSSGITDAQAEAFLAVMREFGDEPMLIHCAGANRAGAMYGLHLGASGACSVDEALQLAKQAGMRSPGLADGVQTQLEARE